MQEILYLILTEGDFDGAKKSNVLERGPFLELLDTEDEDYDGIALTERQTRPRQFKTHLQYSFFEKTFAKEKPKVIIVMRNLKAS